MNKMILITLTTLFYTYGAHAFNLTLEEHHIRLKLKVNNTDFSISKNSQTIQYKINNKNSTFFKDKILKIIKSSEKTKCTKPNSKIIILEMNNRKLNYCNNKSYNKIIEQINLLKMTAQKKI